MRAPATPVETVVAMGVPLPSQLKEKAPWMLEGSPKRSGGWGLGGRRSQGRVALGSCG